MFKLLTTGALFLGAEDGATKGGNSIKALFRKPRAQPAGGVEEPAQYLVAADYPRHSTDCSGQPFERLALQTGWCFSYNATYSSDYMCPDANACITSQYASADCSGTPTETMKVPTDGGCDEFNGGYGRYMQTDDPTSMMGTPYITFFSEADCSGDAVLIIDRSVCLGFGLEHNSSHSQKCTDDGVIQDCLWTSSDTCAGTGKCTPAQPTEQPHKCTNNDGSWLGKSFHFSC